VIDTISYILGVEAALGDDPDFVVIEFTRARAVELLSRFDAARSMGASSIRFADEVLSYKYDPGGDDPAPPGMRDAFEAVMCGDARADAGGELSAWLAAHGRAVELYEAELVVGCSFAWWTALVSKRDSEEIEAGMISREEIEGVLKKLTGAVPDAQGE
jgi:hypothetical protein